MVFILTAGGERIKLDVLGRRYCEIAGDGQRLSNDGIRGKKAGGLCRLLQCVVVIAGGELRCSVTLGEIEL